ncbi:hypothetical protein D3C80_1855460 [compost metagenome]
MLKVAHDQRALHTFKGQALQGLLEQRELAGQGEELLGILLARQGPQAGTTATRKDYRNHGRRLH